jgi:hypothetical protein
MREQDVRMPSPTSSGPIVASCSIMNAMRISERSQIRRVRCHSGSVVVRCDRGLFSGIRAAKGMGAIEIVVP